MALVAEAPARLLKLAHQARRPLRQRSTAPISFLTDQFSFQSEAPFRVRLCRLMCGRWLCPADNNQLILEAMPSLRFSGFGLAQATHGRNPTRKTNFPAGHSRRRTSAGEAEFILASLSSVKADDPSDLSSFRGFFPAFLNLFNTFPLVPPGEVS